MQKKSFHYTFKRHELHTHFITLHSKGVIHLFHYILISYPFKGHDYIPISYSFITIHSLPIHDNKILITKTMQINIQKINTDKTKFFNSQGILTKLC